MRWISKSPDFGDMIRVQLGAVYHFGIYASDSEVIQFGRHPYAQRDVKPEDVEVLITDIKDFLLGGATEVCVPDESDAQQRRSPDEVVEYARKSIGRRGYHILYNNCEHFATECLFGKASCSMTENVRAMFRAIPIVDVFLARMPEDCEIGEVIPKKRNDEIAATNHPRVKKEKYCAWRLVEYALSRSFGLTMEKTSFSKNKHGKWESDSCHFSISHSDTLVAVAVSRAPVGVDIESLDAPIKPYFADRILTEDERVEYGATKDEDKIAYLISKWSAKEAFFKKDGDGGFVPGSTLIDEAQLYTKVVENEGKGFICSVATNTPNRVRFFDLTNGDKLFS